MPRVPEYSSFQVATGGAVNARYDAPTVQNNSGQQLQQLGQAEQNAGATLGKIQLDMQDQANQMLVDDALDKAKNAALDLIYAKDTGFTSLKGRAALDRPDGKALEDEYGDVLKDQISTLSAGLRNDAQRQAFALHSNDILTSLRGQAMQHRNKEYVEYGLSVAEGVQSTAMRDISLNYKDQDAVAAAVGRIKAETYRQAQLMGKSAEWQEMMSRKMTSSAHKVALLSALEQNDPLYADDYLKAHAKEMDADDILTVRGHITKEVNNKVGVEVSRDVVSKVAPQVVTSDGDRAFNIALGTESGGKQFDANGKPLTSPKGAIGIAQVMPATAPEAAKLAGLPWDENRYKNDADYNKALGKAYFQKQLQDNGGDLAKGYAAYNAGPGALQDAIKKADRSVALNKNDPSVPVKTYLDFLPKETRDYVTKNMAAYSAGGGTSQKPTFLDIDNALRADPRLAGNPQRYTVARADAEKRFEEIQKATKAREEDSVAEAQKQLLGNGGKFSALPSSVRNAIPPGKVDDVLAFAGKIAKGQPIETDWSLYYKFKTDPALLGATNLMALRDKLGEGEFKNLVEEQQNVRQGKLNATTQLRSTTDIVNGMMREVGIDPTPKDDDKKGAAKVGRVWNAVETRVREEEQAVGRKLRPDEVKKSVANLFTTVSVDRTLWNTDTPAVMVDPGQKLVVPKADRLQIADALRAARKPVTDTAIEALYRRSKGIN